MRSFWLKATLWWTVLFAIVVFGPTLAGLVMGAMSEGGGASVAAGTAMGGCCSAAILGSGAWIIWLVGAAFMLLCAVASQPDSHTVEQPVVSEEPVTGPDPVPDAAQEQPAAREVGRDGWLAVAVIVGCALAALIFFAVKRESQLSELRSELRSARTQLEAVRESLQLAVIREQRLRQDQRTEQSNREQPDRLVTDPNVPAVDIGRQTGRVSLNLSDAEPSSDGIACPAFPDEFETVVLADLSKGNAKEMMRKAVRNQLIGAHDTWTLELEFPDVPDGNHCLVATFRDESPSGRLSDYVIYSTFMVRNGSPTRAPKLRVLTRKQALAAIESLQ